MRRRPAPREDLPRAVLLEPNDGCLTVARRLAERGVEVVALCSPASSWVAHSNSLRSVPVPSLRDPTVSRWLAALSDLADRPGVLINGTDAAAEFVFAHRAAVPEALSSFEAPGNAHPTLMDKEQLYDLARGVGVRVPATILISERGDGAMLERAALSAPCIAKPVLGHVGRRAGDFTTRRLTDADAVRTHVGAALDAGIPMLVSEVVPGPTSALESVMVIRAADGSYPLEVSRRKVRDYANGIGTLHEVHPSPDAIAQTRLLLEASHFTGIAASEFKRHAVTGDLYLIEVNVRVNQGFGAAEAAGVDASWRLYATLAGMTVPPQPAIRYGRKVWLPQHDLHAFRQDYPGRPRPSVREVAVSLRGVRDFGALSWRDPGPALSLARSEAGQALRKVRPAR